MKIEIRKQDQFNAELFISTGWETVKGDYENILKNYSSLPVKGFRKDKVPIHIIEQKFRRSIYNDLGSRCTEYLCRSALKEKDIEAGSPVSISCLEIEPGSHFSFQANFLKMPKFEIPDYTHLNLHAESHEDKCTEISKKLLEQVSFELHHDFIDRELLFSDENDYDSEEEQRREAANRVKLMLILKKIAGLDNIQVDEKDLERRIQKIAEASDVTPQELKDYLIENNGLSRLRDLLLAEFVLGYIIDIQK